MRVIAVDPMHPRPDRLSDAVSMLQSGGLLALPTETFYGLAVDCLCADALRRVNRAKGKPDDSPILLLLSDPSQVETVASSLPPLFGELTQMFWPGPLTLVVPVHDKLPHVSGGTRGVAVRVPGLELPRALARELGRPISGVSANLHGRPPCRTAVEVAETFGGTLDLILDGGPSAGGAPSTIVDLSGSRPILLREGLLPASALQPFLPDLQPAG